MKKLILILLMLPIFMMGQDFLADGSGNFLVDGSGNFLTVPSIADFYVGKSSTTTLPTESEILAATKTEKRVFLSFSFNPNTAITEYGWVATNKKERFNYRQNSVVLWDTDSITTDAIGSGENLISLSPDMVTVDGEDYYIYMFNYPTDINTDINLKIKE